jgi:phage repressor protein C with HTH and peptisase S24 domain
MHPTLERDTIIIALGLIKYREQDVIVINHQGIEKIKRVEKITKDKLFVTGDNTAGSTDSRNFGWLNKEMVIAKVVWPRKLHKRNHSSLN